MGGGRGGGQAWRHDVAGGFASRRIPKSYVILQEVMGQEAARGRQVVGAKGVLREEEGMVMAARVQEVALEVGQAGRVPVEREVQRIESDSIKLMTILGWDSGPCSSDSQSW